jgi:hypothetical protein
MATTSPNATVEERRFSAAHRTLKPKRLQSLRLLGLLVAFAALLHAQSPAAPSAQKDSAMTHTAKGTFDVKLTPQPSDDKSETPLGRMTLEKQFHGDLEGTSKGEMLTAATTMKGSGAYVAVERVEGTLQGRRGTFQLYHTGVMTRGAPELSVTIVPDSGTGELTGISGKLKIQIDAGKHFYELDYALPESK